MARGLKFGIFEVEGLYYLYSENKGADQLRGYREADLRLCFRICKKPVFSRRGSFVLTRKYKVKASKRDMMVYNSKYNLLSFGCQTCMSVFYHLLEHETLSTDSSRVEG